MRHDAPIFAALEHQRRAIPVVMIFDGTDEYQVISADMPRLVAAFEAGAASPQERCAAPAPVVIEAGKSVDTTRIAGLGEINRQVELIHRQDIDGKVATALEHRQRRRA